MNQIYHHYEKWEDYKAGMYTYSVSERDNEFINYAIQLLSNANNFYNACKQVLDNWKYSAEVNLTNTRTNRRAWLGAAACMFIHNCPEVLTRSAWSLMSEEKRKEANEVATKIICEYERKNKPVCKNMGEQMLF